MKPLKILIVSATFYPVNSPRSFRATELAKEFARTGHNVTVLTPRSDNVHDQFEKDYNLKIKDLGRATWHPVKIKGSGIVRLVRRALVRFPKLLFEYPDIQLMRMVPKALSIESGYNMLISIAVPYPVHWGVAWARGPKKPIANIWVADCGDPYMGQENDTFRPPFYFKYVEKWFCRRADYITVPTEGSIQGYYSEFQSKIQVIPQGFKFEDIVIDENRRSNEMPEFAYGGIFIQGRRDPRQFLKYLISLDLEFRFHIYTKTPDLVIDFIDHSKGRIIVHEPIDRKEFLIKLAHMDFVINFDNVGSKQTPSKLIDYAILDKPILNIRTGDLNIKVINEFLVGDYTNQYNIDRELYRIERVANKFLELRQTSSSLD